MLSFVEIGSYLSNRNKDEKEGCMKSQLVISIMLSRPAFVIPVGEYSDLE